VVSAQEALGERERWQEGPEWRAEVWVRLSFVPPAGLVTPVDFNKVQKERTNKFYANSAFFLPVEIQT